MVSGALRALARRRRRCDLHIMEHMTIQLSDAQGMVIDELTITGEFASISDYVKALVDAESDERARERFEALLLEGLEGEATEMTDADWDELRRSIAGDQ